MFNGLNIHQGFHVTTNYYFLGDRL